MLVPCYSNLGAWNPGAYGSIEAAGNGGLGQMGHLGQKKSKKGRKRLSRALFIFTKKNATKLGKRHDNMFLEVGKNIEKRNHNLYYLKFQILTNLRKNVKSMKT